LAKEWIRGGDYRDSKGAGDAKGGFGDVFVDERGRGVGEDAVEIAT
jgi:hypothetical protein